MEHDAAASLLFFRPGELGLPPAELEQALAVQQRFRQLVSQVPAEALWQAPHADASDRISAAYWLDREGAGVLARYPLAWLTRMGGSGGVEPTWSSILHLAWTLTVVPQHETAEAWLVEGDIAQAPGHLGQDLAAVVRLRTPLTSIHQQDGCVAVDCAD